MDKISPKVMTNGNHGVQHQKVNCIHISVYILYIRLISINNILILLILVFFFEM